MSKELSEMSEEKLTRKIDQHLEMASLARIDNDWTDATRHDSLARDYQQELSNRG